jgi:hypothetical protein
MSRVEEIEAAIDNLQPEEYSRIVEWFRVREQQRWDEQMDADAKAGKLDFLFVRQKPKRRAGCFESGRRDNDVCRHQAILAVAQSFAS